MAIPDKPVTRKEAYLSTIAGQPVDLPEPRTRTELYLEAIAKQGTGGGGDISALQTQVDKIQTKLDGIEDEANKTVVDKTLIATSENPVQNAIVATEFVKMEAKFSPVLVEDFTIKTSEENTISFEKDGEMKNQNYVIHVEPKSGKYSFNYIGDEVNVEYTLDGDLINPSDFVVYDKMVNGFKIRYTGDLIEVTVDLIIYGGV